MSDTIAVNALRPNKWQLSPSVRCQLRPIGKMGTLSILAFLGLVGAHAWAQQAPQGDALRELYFLSGLGVIGKELWGETPCLPNRSGETEASLFASVGGPAAAALEWRTGRYGSCQAFLTRDGQREQLYRGWDTPEISYESAALTYYEQRDGFARVFARTAPPGYWIRISDLPEGRLRPWPELLVAAPHTYVGYEALELHERPSQESSVLLGLRERRVHDTMVHQLVPTGEIAGIWGEFDVIEFTGDFTVLSREADSVPTGNRWKGWLRLLTANGEPRFWFYTRD